MAVSRGSYRRRTEGGLREKKDTEVRENLVFLLRSAAPIWTRKSLFIPARFGQNKMDGLR